ncbi:MAG: hypothetical protein KBT06_03485 [Prevotellaceae bacterium]|nr:hypothetical protein [Candidatus Colivivens equi]
MVTTEEFWKSIKEAHVEELEDHKGYMHLASLANDEHMHDVAGILKDIAHEEETHAQILSHILDEMEE